MKQVAVQQQMFENKAFYKISEQDALDKEVQRVHNHKTLMDKYLGDYNNQGAIIVSSFYFILF